MVMEASSSSNNGGLGSNSGPNIHESWRVFLFCLAWVVTREGSKSKNTTYQDSNVSPTLINRFIISKNCMGLLVWFKKSNPHPSLKPTGRVYLYFFFSGFISNWFMLLFLRDFYQQLFSMNEFTLPSKIHMLFILLKYNLLMLVFFIW